MAHHHSLLFILLVAALAPLIAEVPLRLRPPLVVLELLLGMLVGPQGLALVAADGAIPTLSALGLSFLFFIAGMELDFSTLRGRPLQLGIAGWILSIALALALTYGLHDMGLVSAPLLVAVALATTAIGTLLPILRDAGELDGAFGRLVLGAGAIGEFAPIIVFSLLMADDTGLGKQTELLVTFVLIAVACAALAFRLRPPRIVALLARSLHSTSQLPIRLAILLLGSMVVLADLFDLNLLLGAFAAGAVVGLVARGPEAESFRHKIDALGFGFLIPIFFVVSGTQIDVAALFANTDSLVRVPLFLLLLFVVRGAPSLLYRSLGLRHRLRLALFSATSLPLVVVITGIGTATGRMLPANAAALVGAAILSVLIFPLIALLLGPQPAVAVTEEAEADSL